MPLTITRTRAAQAESCEDQRTAEDEAESLTAAGQPVGATVADLSGWSRARGRGSG